MAFLLHVEYDARTELHAATILKNLARMSEIVHRDHPGVYTYTFRYDDKLKTRLIFTEIYADEKVFLEHASDSEFIELCQQAFNPTSGKSFKELCIRKNIDYPLSPITTNILDNYLHVTYISFEQGYLYQNISDSIKGRLLIICRGCDEHVYERLNAIVNCITCITFQESDKSKQLIAVIVDVPDDKVSNVNGRSSINTMELVCAEEQFIEKFRNKIIDYFEIQSFQIKTSFSGYIHHN